MLTKIKQLDIGKINWSLFRSGTPSPLIVAIPLKNYSSIKPYILPKIYFRD